MLENSLGHVTEMTGHVPEISGHDAEIIGHAVPKYAGRKNWLFAGSQQAGRGCT
jgi:hypothetical protein